jgi:hypothetical protein
MTEQERASQELTTEELDWVSGGVVCITHPTEIPPGPPFMPAANFGAGGGDVKIIGILVG